MGQTDVPCIIKQQLQKLAKQTCREAVSPTRGPLPQVSRLDVPTCQGEGGTDGQTEAEARRAKRRGGHVQAMNGGA